MVVVEYDDSAIRNALSNALFKVALRVQEKAKQKVSKDTADTARNIVIEPMIPNHLSYDIISKKAHSKSLEFGSAPHWVDPDELKSWARRKLGDEDKAFMVARSISKKGTKKHPFMTPAYMETKLEVAEIVRKQLQNT